MERVEASVCSKKQLTIEQQKQLNEAGQRAEEKAKAWREQTRITPFVRGWRSV